MKKILSRAMQILLISIGAAAFAFGVTAFIRPINAPAGGVSGVAQMVSYLSGLPMGVLTIILNIPIFIICWRELGRQIIILSLYGMVLSSVLIDLMDGRIPHLTDNPLLSALFGGVFYGAGLAFVYWQGATTGGTDLIIKLIQKRMEHLSIGKIMLTINVVIIAIAAVVFKSIESALFAIVVQFVSSSVIDAIIHGIDNASMALIITSDPQGLSNVINREMTRGVTGLSGRGMYTNEEKIVLIVAIRQNELGRLKSLVREYDSSSFVVMLNANEVLGRGFKHME